VPKHRADQRRMRRQDGPGASELHGTPTGRHRAATSQRTRRAGAVAGVATLSAALIATAAAAGDGPPLLDSAGAQAAKAVVSTSGHVLAGDRDQRASRSTGRPALTAESAERAKAKAARQARQRAREVRERAREARQARAVRARQRQEARQEARLEARREARLEARREARQEARQAARVAARQWVLPLQNYNLTAHFGEVSYLWSSSHSGLDLAAATGSPVRAIASSVVAEAGYDGAYGNRVVLRLPDGTQHWFGHLNTIDVSVGEQLAAGQQLGTVGSTGHTTGPHLHLEVRINDTPVDPYAALVSHGLQP